MRIGCWSFRLMYQGCFFPFSIVHSANQPAPRNDHSAFSEHMPKITTGKGFLYARILVPRLALRGGFIRSAIAPGDEGQIGVCRSACEGLALHDLGSVVLRDSVATGPDAAGGCLDGGTERNTAVRLEDCEIRPHVSSLITLIPVHRVGAWHGW